MQPSTSPSIRLIEEKHTPLSLVKGPTTPHLLRLTLGQLVDQQAEKFGSKDAVVVPWTGARLSFVDVKHRTRTLAKGLLHLGIRKGDRIAILSGDDERFVELFFACGRIGAIFVILNKTYTAIECERAIRHTGKEGSTVPQAPILARLEALSTDSLWAW